MTEFVSEDVYEYENEFNEYIEHDTPFIVLSEEQRQEAMNDIIKRYQALRKQHETEITESFISFINENPNNDSEEEEYDCKMTFYFQKNLLGPSFDYNQFEQFGEVTTKACFTDSLIPTWSCIILIQLKTKEEYEHELSHDGYHLAVDFNLIEPSSSSSSSSLEQYHQYLLKQASINFFK